MAKRDFSDVRTYAELEASIRMVRRELAASSVSRQVMQFKATPAGAPRWAGLALFVIRALRNRL